MKLLLTHKYSPELFFIEKNNIELTECIRQIGMYVLCRLLDDREVQPFGKSAHRLIIKLPDGSAQERYIIIIKQDIKDLSEVEKIVDGFRRAFLQLEKKGYK